MQMLRPQKDCFDPTNPTTDRSVSEFNLPRFDEVKTDPMQHVIKCFELVGLRGDAINRLIHAYISNNNIIEYITDETIQFANAIALEQIQVFCDNLHEEYLSSFGPSGEINQDIQANYFRSCCVNPIEDIHQTPMWIRQILDIAEILFYSCAYDWKSFRIKTINRCGLPSIQGPLKNALTTAFQKKSFRLEKANDARGLTLYIVADIEVPKAARLVYHGTIHTSFDSILSNGLRIQRATVLDFGQGFYVSSSHEYSYQWATNKYLGARRAFEARRSLENPFFCCVLHYILNDPTNDILELGGDEDAWREFVRWCVIGPKGEHPARFNSFNRPDNAWIHGPNAVWPIQETSLWPQVDNTYDNLSQYCILSEGVKLLQLVQVEIFWPTPPPGPSSGPSAADAAR